MPNATATAAASLLAQLLPRADGWGAQWHGCALASAFQPVLSITHQRVVGYEALLRVTDESGQALDGVAKTIDTL